MTLFVYMCVCVCVSVCVRVCVCACAGRDEYVEAIQKQIAESEEREMVYIDRHNRIQVRHSPSYV